MTAAARRMIGLVLVCALILCAGLWWVLDGRAAAIRPSAPSAARSLLPSPPPPPAAPVAAAPPPAPAARTPPDPLAKLPPALVKDLRRLDDARLKSELQAIAGRFPSVELVQASCPALPCRAEAASDDESALNDFVAAVGDRFGHYLSTRFRLTGDDDGVVHAFFSIGVPEAAPSPRFERPSE
jgi:hypothetical protein